MLKCFLPLTPQQLDNSSNDKLSVELLFFSLPWRYVLKVVALPLNDRKHWHCRLLPSVLNQHLLKESSSIIYVKIRPRCEGAVTMEALTYSNEHVHIKLRFTAALLFQLLLQNINQDLLTNQNLALDLQWKTEDTKQTCFCWWTIV